MTNFSSTTRQHTGLIDTSRFIDVVRLREADDTDIAHIVDIDEDLDDTDRDEEKIICKSCGNLITFKGCIIEINGKHEHTHYNPEGVIYNIGCFSSARGCTTTGQPTLEYTWFAGYAWSLSLCANCHIHLGWHFQSGEKSFFGLIMNKLIEWYQKK